MLSTSARCIATTAMVVLNVLAPSIADEPDKTLTMTPVVIRDPMVNNMVAGSILKPEGWQFQGGVKWYPNMYHQANFEAIISKQGTLQQLEFLPIAYACYLKNPVFPMQRLSNYQGQIVLEPTAPGKLIEEFTLPGHRKVKPESIRHFDMPELARLCQKMSGEGNWKATRTRVSYQFQGQSVEEDFYVACFYHPEVSLGVNNASMISWGVGLAFSIRAEEGELDAATPAMLACVHSLKGNAEHYKQVLYVRSLFTKRMMQNIADAGTISRQINANNDHALALMREARAYKNASEDRISKQFSDYIRGTQEYTNAGVHYSLPSGYNQAWVHSNGTVVLSNDATFDPNTTLTGNWSELKQVR